MHNIADYFPKIVTALKGYTLANFSKDLVAGLTVGLVALPLAMAFGISSGVTPQSGIYCAIIAGFLVSALGGSRTGISGPTGAFAIVVSGIVATYGINGLFICTITAGVMLFALGATGLGTAVKFIPRAVVIGFTNGIAILIATSQIKDFFGIKVDKLPDEFLHKIETLFENFSTLSTPATIVSLSTLVTIIVMSRYAKKIPGTIVALFLGTIVASIFGLNIDTIASSFGGIPSGLPQFKMPQISTSLFLKLLSPAMTIATIGALESLLSAVIADRMLKKDKHNPNVELMAQGIANICSPLFGGLPATGAIARTATSIRSGATTPIAGIVHALVLLFIILFATPLVQHIPLCVLAAILMVVSYNMGEWQEIPYILRQSKMDIAVWFITFSLTVLADLSVAVKAGMLMAVLLYIRKVSATTVVEEITEEYVADGFAHSLQHNPIPSGVKMLRIQGPFLFGSTEKLSAYEERIESYPMIVVLRLRNMTALDGTGLHAIEDFAKKAKAHGRILIICDARPQPESLMSKSGFFKRLGTSYVVPSLKDAIAKSKEILEVDQQKTIVIPAGQPLAFQ